jgi:hypothetical protein
MNKSENEKQSCGIVQGFKISFLMFYGNSFTNINDNETSISIKLAYIQMGTSSFLEFDSFNFVRTFGIQAQVCTHVC